MVSMSIELKERNILKLILIVRFACATLDMGHPVLHRFARFSVEVNRACKSQFATLKRLLLLFTQNGTYHRSFSEWLESVQEINAMSVNKPDEGMNLLVFNGEGF
jgi:hypothetical protein